MAETAASQSPKKSKASKPKKAKATVAHPKVSEMVNTAISTLKERGGSSLQAIKKYIAAHYKVDVDKLAPFIRKYLKNAVAQGSLVQTKGKGASGSFKMTTQPKEKKTPKPKAVAPKPKKASKPVALKKPVIKTKAVKKSPAAKKPKAKVAKSPKKAKVVKPKAPKVKKSKPSPKKSAAKKGKK